MEDEITEPRLPRRCAPFTDLSFATLGWLNRSARAVGADRFFECLERAQFYLLRAASNAHTPGERAIVEGITQSLLGMIQADREARVMLRESCSGMDARDASEFIEMCETADEEPVL